MLLKSTLPLSEGGILCHAKLVSEVDELHRSQGLGKNICYLLFCRDILKTDGTFMNHVSEVVIPHLDVL